MFFLLMMQREKLGCIALYINLVCFLLLRSGKLCLKMRHGKGLNFSYFIMDVNTIARILIFIVLTMGFIERR